MTKLVDMAEPLAPDDGSLLRAIRKTLSIALWSASIAGALMAGAFVLR
ncbi:MAG TPA: hypothetical protein VFC47_00095 [Caulobacteraceae bacterium]|nr:hypothetical protein [Caulobacteraceae bacterium]